MKPYSFFRSYLEAVSNCCIFSFTGYLSQNMLVEMGEELQLNLSQDIQNNSYSRKVFSIFVEMAQNVVKYSNKRIIKGKENNRGYGTISVYKQNHTIIIQSGNPVKSEIVDVIQNKCNTISQKNSDELKSYYKEQRKIPKAEYQKGAGLGFIDIALKTSNQLDIDFIKIDEEELFFVFTVPINI